MSQLPTPNAQQLVRSQDLTVLICQKMTQAGGAIPFVDFMRMALYTPRLGYYSGGAQKFADITIGGGDFVTAPEISPIFAQSLANQAAQILAETQGKNFNSNILELGAGTGKLAVDLLLALQQLEQLPSQYFMLEVSDHLRQIQRETCQTKLPNDLFEKIVWLDSLPEKFSGLMLANEVLDAIPAHIVQKTAAGWCEQYVSWDEETKQFVSILNGFAIQDSKLNCFAIQDSKLNSFEMPNLVKNLPADLPVGYITEVNPAATALVKTLAQTLQQGAIFLIDYGFGAREYYHPQRSDGTLMCHFQHYAHSNPFINVGLQDITAHVDFSQIAEAGVSVGAQLAGFCSQAQFLINCGILTILQQYSPESVDYIKQTSAAQKLLSPAEMGDLFKVIAFSKHINTPLLGFAQSDKAHTL